MDLSTLQKALETAPGRMEKLVAEIEARQEEAGTIGFFLEAVRLLRVSWKDADPGKHGPHWHAFNSGKKAWPRELVDTAVVATHVEERRRRQPNWPDYDVPLVPFAELMRDDCPSCPSQGIVVCCYQQTYDSPGGDVWAKVTYLLCASCKGLYQLNAQQSNGRF